MENEKKTCFISLANKADDILLAELSRTLLQPS